MATTELQSKKILIDLSEDTFRSLSIMAANKGTNLNKQYDWLSENIPEGKEMVGEEEKKSFESWLGV